MIPDHSNYHSLANRYLTNSRIGDYLKDPRFFYELHISGELTRKEKDAWNIGKAVDAWLTRGEAAYRTEFICGTVAQCKGAPAAVTRLTPAQGELVEAICPMLESQPAFSDLKNHKAQQIITLDMPIGEHFVGLSAIPDWYAIDGDRCVVTDLKTTVNGEEVKYHYSCLDYGYYRQMAVITIILAARHPEIKKFVYRHIVSNKDAEWPEPFVYILANSRVEQQMEWLVQSLIPRISEDKEFRRKTVSWEQAEVIGEIDEDF